MGYHTVRLNDDVELEKGTRFAVIIRLSVSKGNSFVYYEAPFEEFSSKARANSGESYFSNGNSGKEWTDLTRYMENANFCIKAFSDNGKAAFSAQLFESIDNDNRAYESEEVNIAAELLASGDPVNPEYIEWSQQDDLKDSPEDYGIIPSMITTGENEVSFADIAILPSAYDLRTEGCVSGVRDQNAFGTCWAHAAYASLESCLLKKAQTIQAESFNGGLGYLDTIAEAIANSNAGNSGITGLVIQPTECTLTPGETVQLEATVFPVHATDDILWSSSDPLVANVDSEGTVTAIGSGSTTITAETKDGNKKAFCTVTVMIPTSTPTPTAINTPTPTNTPKPTNTPTPVPPPAVENIFFDVSEIRLTPGDIYQLKVKYTPTNAEMPDLVWSSTNNSVVRTDQNGFLTAVGEGNARIKVITAGNLEAVCRVVVEKEYLPTYTPTPTDTPILTITPTPLPQVESVTLNVKSVTLKPGERYDLKATVLPKNAVDAKVSWKSGSTKVVKVSSTGRLTAFGEGTASVRAMTANGTKAVCKVTVKLPHVTNIKLNTTSKALNVGLTVQLKATVTPADAVDAAITWKSSNKKVATVTKKGLVTAVRCGTATITATSANGVKAACKITVKQKYAYELEKNGIYRYLSNTTTIKKLAKQGWTYKKAFRVAGKSGNPVYEIYEKKTKIYRYTVLKSEAVAAKKAGNTASIAFYATETSSIPVYELYRSGKKPTYFYTSNKTIVQAMKKAGWKYKGIAWYEELKTLV